MSLFKQNFMLSLVTVCVVFLVLGFFIGRLVQRIRDISKLKNERNDAVKRSRAVLGGQFGEQMAPYFPDFPCNPGDVRFVGKPIDYIAFCGSAEGKEIEEILFIEVKSGDSVLSKREREIKNAVDAKKVRYIQYRIPE